MRFVSTKIETCAIIWYISTWTELIIRTYYNVSSIVSFNVKPGFSGLTSYWISCLSSPPFPPPTGSARYRWWHWNVFQPRVPPASFNERHHAIPWRIVVQVVNSFSPTYSVRFAHAFSTLLSKIGSTLALSNRFCIHGQPISKINLNNFFYCIENFIFWGKCKK